MSEIIIGPKTEFFAWLPNCIVYEWGLSAEALAAALYLNGKPAGWQARPFDIQNHFKWGVRIWRKVSKELKGFGLLNEKKHKEGTSLWFAIPDMSLTITKKPPLQNSTVLKATVTKCHPLPKKDITKKDLIIKKDILCVKTKKELSKSEINLIFDKVWGIYPLKKAKQKALEALTKAFKGKDAAQSEDIATAIWRGLNAHLQEHQAKSELAQQGGDVWVPNLPHLSTWLNQYRWEDEYQEPADILASTTNKRGIVDINQFFRSMNENV